MFFITGFIIGVVLTSICIGVYTLKHKSTVDTAVDKANEIKDVLHK